jgi:2-epi-5-epi-valiolone synthase
MNTYDESRSESWELKATLSETYPIIESESILDPGNGELSRVARLEPGARRLVVVDARVHELYGDRIEHYFAEREVDSCVITMEAGEAQKSLDSVLRVVEVAEEFGLRRYSEPIMAIGGGVISDTVGCAAHLYQRGVPHIRIPTTLVGLVDAGIGVKVGVNYGNRKNLIGAYQAPLAAILDRSFMLTLPARHIKNGMAEIIKIAIACDGRLFELLELNMTELLSEQLNTPVGREVIRRAVRAMLTQIECNPFERYLQRSVDFGHTFSPRIEMDSAGELLHGESVAIDMALCCQIAWKRKMLSQADVARIFAVLVSTGLSLDHNLCTLPRLGLALADTVRHRDGMQHVFLPLGIGYGEFVEDISFEELAMSLCAVREFHHTGRTAW